MYDIEGKAVSAYESCRTKSPAPQVEVAKQRVNKPSNA